MAFVAHQSNEKTRIILVGACLAACCIPSLSVRGGTRGPRSATSGALCPIVLDGIATVQAYNVADAQTLVTGTIQQTASPEGRVVDRLSPIPVGPPSARAIPGTYCRAGRVVQVIKLGGEIHR